MGVFMDESPSNWKVLMPISWFLSVYDYGTLAAAVVQLIGILHCLSSVPKLGLMIAITMFIEVSC